MDWLVNSTATLDTIVRNETLIEEDLILWNVTGKGPFTDPGANQIAWLRMPENSTVFDATGDPSAGPNSAHIELLPAVCCSEAIYRSDLSVLIDGVAIP